jgi:hypothetical protein
LADKIALLENIDKIHATGMGIDRIKRNLNLDVPDVVEFCKNKVLDRGAVIYKQGKNWYCEVDSIKITINSHSYTIITAHIICKSRFALFKARRSCFQRLTANRLLYTHDFKYASIG